MSDVKNGLPVRTEQDADQRVQVKVVDYTTPTQGQTVDTDGNAQVKVHGTDPAAADQVLRLSQLGAVNSDGFYDATNNTKPAHAGSVVHTRAATPADTDLVIRQTGIANSTIHAADVAVCLGDGSAISNSNPLPVTFSPSGAGTEVNDYKKATAIAAAGTDNHDLTVAGSILLLNKVWASASARCKCEVQVDPTGSAGYSSLMVGFGSVANPNILMEFAPVECAVGAKIRVIMTNTDNQAQDLYSTIVGVQL